MSVQDGEQFNPNPDFQTTSSLHQINVQQAINITLHALRGWKYRCFSPACRRRASSCGFHDRCLKFCSRRTVRLRADGCSSSPRHDRSLLQTAPPKPYSLSLAILTTSSSVLNLITVATGPKISSWATRALLLSASIKVGSTNSPLPNSPSSFLPPVMMRQPSCSPILTYFKMVSSWPALTCEPIWVSSSQGSPTLIFLNSSAKALTNLS